MLMLILCAMCISASVCVCALSAHEIFFEFLVCLQCACVCIHMLARLYIQCLNISALAGYRHTVMYGGVWKFSSLLNATCGGGST